MTDMHDAGKPATRGSRARGAGTAVTLGWVGACLFVHSAVAQQYRIPSGSMEPSLLVGDYILASKSTYGWSRYSIPFSPDLFRGRIMGRVPDRGDVAVFRAPGTDQDYVKRVIGLPGDRVQVRRARLLINGVEVPRSRVADVVTRGLDGREAAFPAYDETLPNGVTHRVVQVMGDRGPLSDTPVYEVPPDHLFMMGDDRDNSADSRIPVAERGIGFVPVENLVAKADLVTTSFAHDGYFSYLWRWPSDLRLGRLFHPVG